MSSPSYTQPEKNEVRQLALRYAVEQLSQDRLHTTCVERDYVRNVFQYLSTEPSVELRHELGTINPDYIDHWENLFDSTVGRKESKDLVVCYLAGPEPKNDFNVLISLGILPQNIWAFENDAGIYRDALKECEDGIYPQPRLIKQSIESFFRETPRKFDIVYIDACGAIPSTQHALRCVSSMIKYHRLSSPGILITNFARPYQIDQSSIDCIADYLYCKHHAQQPLEKWNPQFAKEYSALQDNIRDRYNDFYSEFITSCLCDICAVIMPIQRFVNSQSFSALSIKRPEDFILPTVLNGYLLKNCSLGRLALLHDCIKPPKPKSPASIMWNEFCGDSPFSTNAIASLRKLFYLKEHPELLKEEIRGTYNLISDQSIFYQFLDRPQGSIYLDFVINQLAYPMHAQTSGIRRYVYRAKETDMFTDIIPLDECRYIYDWFPGMHQVDKAYLDHSWQNVFRFALDGLVKQRLEYNNEFFFSASVIGKYEDGFESKKLSPRIHIEGSAVRESA